MATRFDQLPGDLQEYLAGRFQTHGLDPELAYEELVPADARMQGAEAVEAFVRNKHISHIYPQSDFPHLADSLENVFFEDSAENLARGNRQASPLEVWEAQNDGIADLYDGDYDDDGLVDSLEGLFGG